MTVYVPQAMYDELVEQGHDVSNIEPLAVMPKPVKLQPVRWVNREARRAAIRARRRKH